MNLKTLGVLALVAFIGVNAFRFQARGKKIAELEPALADTRLKLATSQQHEQRLVSDSAKLAGNVGELLLEKQTAKAEAAEARANAQASQQKAIVAVAGMTALQKKQAADRPSGGVNAIPTTVEQEVLNGDVASLKGQLDASESTVNALTTENGQLRAENKTLKDENSDLETILNSVTSKVQRDFTESIEENHFLGIGQKASKRKLRDKVLNHLEKKP